MNYYEAYLGSLILEPDRYLEHPLDAIDFPTEYRDLYLAITEHISQGHKVDLVTLTSLYRDKCWWPGSDVISSYIGSPMPSMIGEYAKEIKKESKTHQLQGWLLEANTIIKDADPYEALTQIESSLIKMYDNQLAAPYKTIADILKDNQDLEFKALHTGVTLIDDRWLLDRGGLHIIAGRPGIGKSAFACWLSTCLLFRDYKVLFFSLEMPDYQVANRFQGIMSDEILKYDLLVNDTPAIKIENIMLISQLVKNSKGLDVIVVDYMQLVKSMLKGSSREQVVAHISAALKELARRLDCVVIALCQLNRMVEQTADKRPSLSHLRESGSIEQDADSVVLLYRPEYYYKLEKKPVPQDQIGKVEVIIAKQRNRDTGTLACTWDRDSGVWQDWYDPKDLMPITKFTKASYVYGGNYDAD